jgi:hypothetical protein
MRRIEPYGLWVGSIVDGWNLRELHNAGIRAIVDLASNEAPIKLTRDLTYCRFPIVDGVGNDRMTLRLAVDTLTALVEADLPTLVFCSAGMSRSPLIAAAAIARLSGQPLSECLQQITTGYAHDVGASLIWDVQETIAQHHWPRAVAEARR